MVEEARELHYTLIEEEDFLTQRGYHRWGKLLQTETGQAIWRVIVRWDTVNAAKVVSGIGLPAVRAIAEECKHLATTDETKQFCGAVMCCLLLNNGMRKTNRKPSVGHRTFGRGELYVDEFESLIPRSAARA